MQLLRISVYSNSGVKLKTGVVVMYRVHVDNRWLPWVSNAEPQWMRKVHSKYKLDGKLDTVSYYAGNEGQNINGVEVRIFEEENSVITPVGKYKIIDAPFLTQLDDYPTGCESVTTVMALKHAGVNLSVDTFIDRYLDKKLSGVPFNPMLHFGGDPRRVSGYGCYSPVILKALLKILEDKTQYAEAYQGKSLSALCAEYIDKDIPVILWATNEMAPPYKGNSWTYNDLPVQWISPMHCLLLVGYDDNHYIFNDPLKRSARTYYSKASVERAYEGLYKQAIVVKKYARPKIPAVPKDAAPMKEMIEHIKALETECLNYYSAKNTNLTPMILLESVLGYLRNPTYGDWEWFFTTATGVDENFINYVKVKNSNLYNYLDEYIKFKNRKDVTDGNIGIIDFSHMAATIAGYFGKTIPEIPDFWAGWGGDLATGMKDTTYNIQKRNEGDLKYKDFEGMSNKEVADATIGKANLNCNYSDFCADFDGFKIQQKIKELAENKKENYHLFSDALSWYYGNSLYNHRFKWISEELGCIHTLKPLTKAISDKMKVKVLGIGNIGFITVASIKGGNPSKEVYDLCCESFASYIFSMNQ